MIRTTMADIPAYALPDGYSIRPYSQGDEHAWVEINRQADKYNEITLDLFKHQFNSDIETLRQRQYFLCDPASQPIGTATAWFDNDYNGQQFGRVHWVAILPAAQGRGLSKPLMTTVMNRLAELGHQRTYLTTATVRVPAIKLYLQFGFVPEITCDRDSTVWRALRQQIAPSALDAIDLDG